MACAGVAIAKSVMTTITSSNLRYIEISFQIGPFNWICRKFYHFLIKDEPDQLLWLWLSAKRLSGSSAFGSLRRLRNYPVIAAVSEFCTRNQKPVRSVLAIEHHFLRICY